MKYLISERQYRLLTERNARLNESDLTKVIKRFLNEQTTKPDHPNPKDKDWAKKISCLKPIIGNFTTDFNGSEVFFNQTPIYESYYFYDGSVYTSIGSGSNRYIGFWYCDGDELKVDKISHFNTKLPSQAELFIRQL